MLDLSKVIRLPKTSRYRDPENPETLLPSIYGRLVSSRDGGAVPLILVDRESRTYVAGNHALSEVLGVFDGDGIELDPSEYDVRDQNLQGQGVVTTVQMRAQETNTIDFILNGGEGNSFVGSGSFDKLITARSGLSANVVGKEAVGGGALENPYDVRLDFILNEAGQRAGDIDFDALERNRQEAERLQYSFGFVVDQDRTLREWLSLWDADVIATHILGSDGRLRFLNFTEGPNPTQPTTVKAEIVAGEDCVDGERGIEWVLDDENLANSLELAYEYSWATGRYHGTISPDDDPDVVRSIPSINQYGEVHRELRMQTVRTRQHAASVASTILFAFGGILRRQWVLRMKLKGFRFAALEPLDYVQVSAARGPLGETASTYSGVTCIVLNTKIDPIGGWIDVDAVEVANHG